jgi:hypothetical protein
MPKKKIHLKFPKKRSKKRKNPVGFFAACSVSRRIRVEDVKRFWVQSSEVEEVPLQALSKTNPERGTLNL